VSVGDYKVPLKNNNTMYPYDYTHNPELFNHTKTGKIQNMRKTQEGGKGDGFGGSLSKAGATAMGFDASARASGEGMNKTMGSGTTQHWQSTYKTAIEASL
jgi:hypothetical protein